MLTSLFTRGDHCVAQARDCPVCGEPGNRVRFIGQLKSTVQIALERPQYDLVQCRSCELIFISPEPSTRDLDGIYVESTQFTDGLYTDPARVQAILEYMGSCLARILKRIGPIAQDTVSALEIGAGLAWMCRAVKTLDPKNLTVAQDISPEAVEKCPWVDSYFWGEVSSVQLDRRAPYHIISMTHVIEHLVDPVAVVKRCKELLAHDGVILITAPHRPIGWKRGSTDISLWESYSYNHVPAHIQYFSKKSMKVLAKRAGCALDYWSDVHEDGQALEAWLI